MHYVIFWDVFVINVYPLPVFGFFFFSGRLIPLIPHWEKWRINIFSRLPNLYIKQTKYGTTINKLYKFEIVIDASMVSSNNIETIINLGLMVCPFRTTWKLYLP